MKTKKCNTCNLTFDVGNFKKGHAKCKKCYKKHITCKHNTQKMDCRKCNPKNFCDHDTRKRNCHICNPKVLCKHNIRKGNCPKCNPKILCKHDTRKQDCCECSPQNICEHNIKKRTCPKCNPKVLCKHDKDKYSCPKCNPKILCNHNKLKGNCPKCNPKILCKHNKLKRNCPKCSSKILCKHNNWKQQCSKCGGSKMCIHCKQIYAEKRYVESLDKKVRCCAGCFYRFYPNDKIPRRYKMKQHYFNEKLIEEFGVNFFQYDKKIKCGCSGRMPDWFIDCFKYSIIIELDEDQHKYNSCDEKRMMELFQDLGNRNLVLIRINPDKYKGKTKKRKGCFDFDEKNTLICNEKKFNKRFNLLIQKIKYYMDNQPTKELTIERLFFDT